MQHAIDDSLYFAGCSFQYKKIVRPKKCHACRLIESGNYGAHGEIVVQHDGRCRSWLNHGGGAGGIVSGIKIAFVGADCRRIYDLTRSGRRDDDRDDGTAAHRQAAQVTVYWSTDIAVALGCNCRPECDTRGQCIRDAHVGGGCRSVVGHSDAIRETDASLSGIW